MLCENDGRCKNTHGRCVCELVHNARIVPCTNTPYRTQHHAGVMEKSDENRTLLLAGMDYLVNISFVPDDEVFKITLDYWNFLVPDVYSSVCTINVPVGSAPGHDDLLLSPLGLGRAGGMQEPTIPADRKTLYAGVLSNLRRLMIARMARPEEVRWCVL